ncbi:hypothetical protein Cadr_000026129 [Camelus dromedarius]|uniref:Uncharacterized protein n=1 Tax=Camelus dromedarius TaxID=9838 RepID=A0A5N4CF57_CAMDR|nr:hypothetical protein Cadr_000026129 [Camelus dromedarius]
MSSSPPPSGFPGESSEFQKFFMLSPTLLYLAHRSLERSYPLPRVSKVEDRSGLFRMEHILTACGVIFQPIEGAALTEQSSPLCQPKADLYNHNSPPSSFPDGCVPPALHLAHETLALAELCPFIFLLEYLHRASKRFQRASQGIFKLSPKGGVGVLKGRKVEKTFRVEEAACVATGRCPGLLCLVVSGLLDQAGMGHDSGLIIKALCAEPKASDFAHRRQKYSSKSASCEVVVGHLEYPLYLLCCGDLQRSLFLGPEFAGAALTRPQHQHFCALARGLPPARAVPAAPSLTSYIYQETQDREQTEMDEDHELAPVDLTCKPRPERRTAANADHLAKGCKGDSLDALC